MSKQQSNFRETDVRRAVRAVESAGVKIGRIELQKGKIIIIPGATESERPANEWIIDPE
jgi:hypothetical protein